MRDGIILFTDGSGAEYERIARGEATIHPTENLAQAILAIASYQQKSRGGSHYEP